MPPPNVTAAEVTGDPQMHENVHVHAIYDQIASHFSSTRYKPWPIIAQFLSSIPAGSVGLDSGTGNGKYLPLPTTPPVGSIWTIGMDRSLNLLDIAKTAGGMSREVVWGDVLGNSWRPGAFDYAISIATIHHLATPERRKAAVKRLLQCVKPSGGRVLIYVWAVEQDELSKRNIPRDEYKKTDPNATGRDVFVPWVMKTEEKTPGTEAAQTFNRYYHMFEQDELTRLVVTAAKDLDLDVGGITESPPTRQMGIEIVQDGWERSNYYVEIRRWYRHD